MDLLVICTKYCSSTCRGLAMRPNLDCLAPNENESLSVLSLHVHYLFFLKAPRSRLLGDPNELDECSAPPRTFWSFLFGSGTVTQSDKPEITSPICSRSDSSCLWSKDNDHVANGIELALDSVVLKEIAELVRSRSNQTSSTDTPHAPRSELFKTVATAPILVTTA